MHFLRRDKDISFMRSRTKVHVNHVKSEIYIPFQIKLIIKLRKFTTVITNI